MLSFVVSAEFSSNGKKSNRSWYQDKEIEIIYQLSQNVLEHEEMLNHASDICGELDRWALQAHRHDMTFLLIWRSLLALTQGAKSYKYSRPHITQRNIIRIKNGR